MLERIRSEVAVSNHQYGGVSGCGHMLVEAIDYVTSSLEDNRAAVVLTSMDYSKAFNRLEHSACLREFAAKGATNEALKIIAGFLTGRKMTVRVGIMSSVPRPVNAGTPQGSVLGCFLFNIGIDTIEDSCPYPIKNDQIIQQEHLVRTDDFPAFSTPSRVTTLRRLPELSPIREDGPNIEVPTRAANVPP